MRADRSSPDAPVTKKPLNISILNGVLRALFVFSPRLYRRADLAELRPRRILVARPDHIGDAILATPAIRALRRRYPDASVTFAVASWSAPLFPHLAEADEVFTIDPPWWIAKRNGRAGHADRFRIWRTFIARLLELRRRRFDLCLELRGDVRQIVAFGWFVRPRAIVSYRRNGGHFLTDGWLLPRADRHEALQDLDLAAMVGCGIDDPVPRIALGAKARAATHDLLRQHGFDGDTVLAVIHPSAKQANAWPQPHFIALLDAMMEDRRIRVVLTGARSDRTLHRALEAVAPTRIVSCAGLSLLEVAALVERADLFVTADTGPMHLLNGTATRSVLLFGPTKPQRFAPFGSTHRILEAGWCCDEELHDVCRLDPTGKSGRCMASLDADRVIREVRSVIAEIDGEHERRFPEATVIEARVAP